MSVSVISKDTRKPKASMENVSAKVIAVGRAALLILEDDQGDELRIELKGKAAEQLAAWYFGAQT